jgi:hypothetical protein
MYWSLACWMANGEWHGEWWIHMMDGDEMVDGMASGKWWWMVQANDKWWKGAWW